MVRGGGRTREEREDGLVLRLLVTEAEHGDQPVVIERLINNEDEILGSRDP
jgi:hypothetical protein